MSRTDIKKYIATKTDQFNAADLGGREVFTITGATVKEARDQGPLTLQTDHPSGLHFRPGRSMMKALAEDLWGTKENPLTDASQWVGRRVEIFADDSVENYRRETVGGVRISGVSHIERNTEIRVRTRRGQFTIYKIRKLEAPRTDPTLSDRIGMAVDHWQGRGLSIGEISTIAGGPPDSWKQSNLETLMAWFKDIKDGNATLDDMRATAGGGEE